MTSARDAATSVDYTYDGDGMRLSATVNEVATTGYAWDTNNPLPLLAAETTATGEPLRRYGFGLDLLTLTDPTGTHTYNHDGIGSVAAVTDASGQPAWTYTYEPFGRARTQTPASPDAPANPMRFTGELHDTETDLYHLRARQYDPATGRFTRTDPVSLPLTQPHISAYAYAANRPTVLIDPSGMVTVGGCVGAQGALGILGLSLQVCGDYDFTGSWEGTAFSITGGWAEGGLILGVDGTVRVTTARFVRDLNGEGAALALGYGPVSGAISSGTACNGSTVAGLELGTGVGAGLAVFDTYTVSQRPCAGPAPAIGTVSSMRSQHK